MSDPHVFPFRVYGYNFLIQFQCFFLIVFSIVFLGELKDYFYIFWLFGVPFRV